MPNWCSTTMFFYSKNEEKLVDFKNKLTDVYNSGETIRNDFGNGWLGDFVNTLLAPEFNTEIENSPRCRGSITDPPDWEIYETSSYSYFCFNTETAWAPMVKMWWLIIQKHFPDEIYIAYTAEECGWGIYVNYDPDNLFYFDKYYLYYCINDKYEIEYFSCLEEVVEYIVNIEELKITKEQLHGKSLEEINQLTQDIAYSLGNDNFFNIHEYQTLNFDEAIGEE